MAFAHVTSFLRFTEKADGNAPAQRRLLPQRRMAPDVQGTAARIIPPAAFHIRNPRQGKQGAEFYTCRPEVQDMAGGPHGLLLAGTGYVQSTLMYKYGINIPISSL